MITELLIENYKSIENISIKPKQFNLFIGRPNVGKSNLLEAISLLGAPNCFLSNNKGSLYDAGIRCKEMKHIFNSLNKNIVIRSNNLKLNIEPSEGRFIATYSNKSIYEVENEDGDMIVEGMWPSLEFNNKGWTGYDFNLLKSYIHDVTIKFYLYRENSFESKLDFSNSLSLSFPYGQNLFEVISNVDSIHSELRESLGDYGFELFEIEDQNGGLFLHKKVNNRNKLLPYYLMADTFKRYLFHFAAIHTNENQTILFEEPESHSYPPYIHQLAQNIVASNNQYFIATHSPYLYNVMVKECDVANLNVFYVDYKEHKTIVKLIPRDMIKDFQEYGSDIFFNIENHLS